MRNNANLREIESVMKVHKEDIFIDDQVGFIAPFNNQIYLARAVMPDAIIKDTIHKFQGRECEEIIFSTVLDKKQSSQGRIDFVDNASLVNVAVSRAKRKFTLVTGDDVFTYNNHYIASLSRYIKYYANDIDIYSAPVISAFDLLYNEYDASLI